MDGYVAWKVCGEWLVEGMSSAGVQTAGEKGSAMNACWLETLYERLSVHGMRDCRLGRRE